MKTSCVMCPGHDMFKAFLTQHGQTPVSEYIISPSPNSMACLLHWCVLLQLLVPLSLEQAQQLLADHGEVPVQAGWRRISEQMHLSAEGQDESTQVKKASQVPVATPHAELAENSHAPQTARRVESVALQLAPTDERQTLPMQVDRQEEATGAAAAPVGRSQVSVAKPHTKTACGAPRPTLPPPSGPQPAKLIPRLMRTTVAWPSALVAAPVRVRFLGHQVWSVRWGVLARARQYSLRTQGRHFLSSPLPHRLSTSNPAEQYIYTKVDKSLSEQAYLVDLHFYFDEICTLLAKKLTILMPCTVLTPPRPIHLFVSLSKE